MFVWFPENIYIDISARKPRALAIFPTGNRADKKSDSLTQYYAQIANEALKPSDRNYWENYMNLENLWKTKPSQESIKLYNNSFDPIASFKTTASEAMNTYAFSMTDKLIQPSKKNKKKVDLTGLIT